jgi:gamma-glutamyltranspeptidase/glutathione hydrolase
MIPEEPSSEPKFDPRQSNAGKPIIGRNFVASSQPLATRAGLEMLKQGGNAVDAALACAISLTVLEPTGNGLGGDCFAIVSAGGRLFGLNACGRSPRAFDPERFAGLEKIPPWGWEAVTIPGQVSGWVELSQRFGRMPFAKLFEPAIRYAHDGYPVEPITAGQWARAAKVFRDYPGFMEVFAPQGRPPEAGEKFRSEAMAGALELIADTSGEAFYRGEIAREIAECAAKDGGLMTEEDLAEHQAEWVEPLEIAYRKVTLHELPPPGQGTGALIAAGILSHFPLTEMEPYSAPALHLQIEAMKLAFSEVYHHVADPDHMEIRPADLLDGDFLAALAVRIDTEHAQDFDHGGGDRGGTVCLAAADAEGMMVSFIQSNYRGFGSGIVIPRYGIAMQNRGCGFTLREGHPNRAAGSKRPFHTIIPGFATRNGEPLMAFGLMGGPMQPQGHLQLLTSIFDWGIEPQAASDAPRWQVTEGLNVLVEDGFDESELARLEAMGHRLTTTGPLAFGGAQIILRMEDGTYLGASDYRKDGFAAGI